MKTAVIIGATGGIGSELSKRLASQGYKIIPVSRSGQIKCDLTSYNSIEHALRQIKEQVEKVDLLVNAAGVATYKNLVKVSNDDLQEAFMVNVIAPAIFIRELITHMTHDGALVINIGSGAGTTPMKGRSIYCATKYALRGLTLSLNEEYRDQNPKFCLITLGSTLTNFGSMSIEEKKGQAQKGKAFLSVKYVVDSLVKIISDPNRKEEITLFPS